MLAERIRSLRRARGLSQEQLAERVDVSRQAVSKWETGQSVPELSKLLALSEALGVSLDTLTAGSEQADTAPAHRTDAADSSPASPRAPLPRKTGRTVGAVLCLAGGGLLLVRILLLLIPEAAGAVDASSTITLNGSGLLTLLCALLTAAGLFLLFWKK